MERLSKKDRKMLETYLLEEQFENKETKKHTENMYQKNVHNIVEYDTERKEYENIEETKQEEIKPKERHLDKYELYKLKKEEEKQKEISNVIDNQEIKKKNQILNF